MGVTYRATDTSLQRKVALKIIKIDIAPRSADARERFCAKRVLPEHCDTNTSPPSTNSECALRQANIFTRWN